MTDYRDSLAAQPHTPGTDSQGSAGRWPIHTIGYVMAAILTVASFAMATTHLLTPASLVAALVVLAIGQMVVHLIFFLHITTAPAHNTNILAVILTLLIIGLVVIGSVWIMSQLHEHMMPMDQLMRMQR
jgi:cytochrome o ubiquinol oxidase operon protein cyoD